MFHVASVGIDTLLGAIAYGASQVLVLADRTPRPTSTGRRSSAQIGYAQTILTGARLRRHAPAARRARPRPRRSSGRSGVSRRPRRPRRGHVQPVERKAQRRSTSSSIISRRHAPAPRDEIPLAAGAPYGAGRGEPGRPARCAWPASAPVPNRRCSTAATRRCSSSSSATACSAGCASRPARRRRSRSRRACCSTPQAQAGGRAQPGRAVQLRALRQAVRHQADDRQHGGKLDRPFDVCQAGRCAGCRCAPIAG